MRMAEIEAAPRPANVSRRVRDATMASDAGLGRRVRARLPRAGRGGLRRPGRDAPGSARGSGCDQRRAARRALGARSPALRRTGLTGEDEPRAVLVDVIDRLCDRDFAALRRYLAYQRDAAAAEAAARDEAAEHDEAGLVERLARLAGGPDDPPAPTADADLTTGTPLRGWLLLQTRFVIKDHVKQRLGWRAVARWAAEVAATIPPPIAGRWSTRWPR
jgi:hypothetical protein